MVDEASVDPTLSTKSDVLRAYEEARARGARHEALAIRARHAVETGDLDGRSFGTDRPLIIASRRAGTSGEPPVAFLASFAGRDHDVVFLLKRGVTRVGRGAPFGDFLLPERILPPIEGRQWLVVHRPGHVWIMDDMSTNESVVLPCSAPRVVDAIDPRWDDGVYDYVRMREKASQAVTLDWTGTVVADLHEGDVLLTIYAALVFGIVSLPARPPSSPIRV
jgi:hypothetical protein